MDDITSSRKGRPVRGTTPHDSLSDAKKLQSQKIAELERHRGGRFNLDDGEMFRLVRYLASSHGYTVLQAIQEWHRLPRGEAHREQMSTLGLFSECRGEVAE